MADKTEISLPDGKQFMVEARNLSKQNRFVQWAFLNGDSYYKSYITHGDIIRGGKLILLMGDQPSTRWGVTTEDLPGKHQ